MCGRYFLDVDEDIYELRLLLAELTERRSGYIKTGEVFPTDTAMILRTEGGRMVPGPMRWGIPMEKGGLLINARAETAARKPTFKESIRERRIAVPTTGFFEWRKEGARKRRYMFTVPGEQMCWLAGLYNNVIINGEQREAFAILTTAADEYVSAYHHRMPVVLTKDELMPWLSSTEYAMQLLASKRPDLEAEDWDAQFRFEGLNI